MRKEIAITLLMALLRSAFGKGGLCEVETGQSNIIMDIEESRGTEISQETSPVELPIRGDPFTDVHLELSFPKGHPLFILNGRKLQLLQPLDRDKDNLSHIVFQVTCTDRVTNKKRTIPVIVRVSDVNDNAPEFINTPYEVSISELSPVGTTVFTGLKATDPDAGANGLVEYRVVAGRPAVARSTERLAVADGSQYFAINLPHQGQVTVVKPLDYERTQRYLLTIVASEPFSQSIENENNDTAEVMTSSPGKSFSNLTFAERSAILDGLLDLQKYGPFDIHSKNDHTSENDNSQSILELLNQSAQEEKTSLATSHSNRKSTVPDITQLFTPDQESKLHQTKPVGNTSKEPFSQSAESKNDDTAEVTTSRPLKSFSEMTLTEQNDFLDSLRDWQKYNSLDVHTKHNETSENAMFQSILELLNQLASEEQMSQSSSSRSKQNSTVQDVSNMIAPPKKSKLYEPKPLEETSKKSHPIDDLNLLQSLIEKSGKHGYNPSTNNAKLLDSNMEVDSGASNFSMLPTITFKNNVPNTNDGWDPTVSLNEKKPDLLKEMEVIIGAKFDHTKHNKRENASLAASRFESSYPQETSMVSKEPQNLSSLNQSYGYTQDGEDIGSRFQESNSKDVINETKTVDGPEKNRVPNKPDELKKPVIYIGATIQNPLKEKKINNTKNALISGSSILPKGKQLTFKEPDLNGYDVHRLLNETEKNESYLKTPEHFEMEAADILKDRARNQTSRLSSTTTLTVNVKDDDDQNPSFIYQGCVVLDGSCVNPEYYTTVSSGVLAGVLTIHPEKIQAVDMDSLNTPIVYSFLSGNPDNFRDFFEINPNTGVVRQVRAVDSTISKKFTIIVKAEEASEGRRFATAKLVITVKPVDASPPLLAASAKEGFVQENSPIGTRILDANAKPITLSVTDADLGPDDPKPTYVFELTTNYFDVDSEGYLTVGEENLDRDPPSPGLFRFQVVAREKTGSAASAPITLSVVLTDVNDNAPRLPMIPPVEVQAGEGHREIVNVTATDNDLGENAIISYSIYHVSNNGRNKFQIDPLSGVIESVGKLNAGEQYSITVQATDSGGKHSQTIVEIKVVPGPNTRSPVFKENTYEVTVSEGAPINSTVTTIYALDPEKEPVTYSIIAGNDLRQFGINDKSGVISVRRKLDREDLTRYQLLIKAEDEGGLSSTATVNIHVSDINDKNPEFVGEPYDWKVREGLVGAHVGVVEATDADEGINANITYSVPDEVPFTINPQTGTVMTSTSLDYEKQKEYKFVVTAKDGAMEPRLATATVTVSVVDVEDEMPIFHKPFYEATVPENTPDYFVTQVTADDPDTVKKINYVMKQGPTELFSVDPHDGTIKTLKGLDYESEPEYDLVIGTLENNTTHKGSTTTVRIRVTDVNDIPPVFLTTSGPVTLDDNVSIGTVVTTLVATDSDGTAPGNKIRYEIVGRGKATKYFQIDPDLGKVTVRDDLRKEPDIDYQVDVKAYDLGDPQLSSVTSVPVFVRHVAVASPPIHLGFPDDSYTLQVPEDTKPGSLLKSFAVIASTSVQHIPLRCSIVNGNNESLFFVNITGEKTCDLHLANKSLDYEKKNEYVLRLRLDSLADYVNHNKSVTTVKIQVTDVNDNTPKFVYPSNSKLFKKDKYFGAVAKDKKEVRTILQVKAEDKDSSGLTQLEYMLEPTEMNEFFGIDSASGNIRLRRSVDGLKPEELPVRLTVLVTDGKENGHTATAQVVINLIDEKDWLVLPIGKVAPEAVSDKEAQITELLSQATGTLVGVQRIGPLESTPDNVTLASDPTSTDLWLYFIDPETEMILPINDTNLAKTVKDEDVLANITAEVTTALGGGILYPLHSPIKVRAIKTAVVALDWEVFPYAVILIAGLILVLGTAGIVYICISWQRYKAYKERMQRMYVMPRYDPVFVEPNLKEYETQVLQMSVPMDDNDSYHDLQLDFSRKNHAFSLDNVSYITKDHGDNGGQSPTSSEAATTTRASSLGRHNNNNIHREGAINLSYDRSDDEMGHNSSPTNENVTFREKKDYSHLGFNYLMDRSPIETTTEL